MLTVAKGVNLAVMFLLELGVLASVGYWGFTVSPHLALRLLAGLGGPALFIAVWAIFGAANDPVVRLTGVARAMLEILWFGGGAVALVASGLVTTGTIFAALYILNAVLRLVWNQV
ncbi:YrdB family protein [Planotetraspora sp. GP83]|uniref:YrdB family protein n=1 Tax=Planotetraspora sp. GP83 TaxID=3156264 RepID=UPI003513BE2A